MFRECLDIRYVALITLFSPNSIQPAGTIKISPSGEKHNRRKNDLMVSSWNMRKDFGLVSGVPSEFLGTGRDILETLYTQVLLEMLNILHDL